MKATDLMIGDWVRVTHCDDSTDFAMVSQIGTEEIKARDKNGFLQRYAKSRFWPIPLTEEILKENGFAYLDMPSRHEFDGYYIDSSDTLELMKIGSNFYLYVRDINIKIQYVHELQHALRLCGLTELADNFKIG